MRSWEVFEKNSILFLNKSINTNKYLFKNSGGSNSREVDIGVFYNSNQLFSIEAKFLPSQCGQFVVSYKDGLFTESSKNYYSNSYNSEILNQINSLNINLNKVNNLSLNQTIMFKWIKEHYLSKGVKYFIVSNKLDSDFKLIDVESLNKYFKFDCVIRRKKSGSRDVSKSKRREVIYGLINQLNFENNKIIKSDINGKSLVVSTQKSVENKYFLNKKFFLSETNDKVYKVKQLSSTNNPSVIFSIDYEHPPLENGIRNLLNFISSMSH